MLRRLIGIWRLFWLMMDRRMTVEGLLRSPEIEERIYELRQRGNTVHVHMLDKEVAA